MFPCAVVLGNKGSWDISILELYAQACWDVTRTTPLMHNPPHKSSRGSVSHSRSHGRKAAVGAMNHRAKPAELWQAGPIKTFGLWPLRPSPDLRGLDALLTACQCMASALELMKEIGKHCSGKQKAHGRARVCPVIGPMVRGRTVLTRNDQMSNDSVLSLESKKLKNDCLGVWPWESRQPPDYSSNLCPPKTFAIWLFGECFGPPSCCFVVSYIKGPPPPPKKVI